MSAAVSQSRRRRMYSLEHLSSQCYLLLVNMGTVDGRAPQALENEDDASGPQKDHHSPSHKWAEEVVAQS